MVNNKEMYIESSKDIAKKGTYFRAKKLFSCIEINYLLYLMLV